MTEVRLDRIEGQLEVLTRLVAMSLVDRDAGLAPNIDVLDRVGLGPSLIAELLGTTPNTVSVQLVKLRKARKSGRRKRKEGKSSMAKKKEEGPDTAVLEELQAVKRLLAFGLLRDGASQAEVAAALGVGQATVSRMFGSRLSKKGPRNGGSKK